MYQKFDLAASIILGFVCNWKTCLSLKCEDICSCRKIEILPPNAFLESQDKNSVEVFWKMLFLFLKILLKGFKML